MSHTLSVLRACMLSSGRVAFRQNIAAYAGLGLVCSILFGGNGLDAGTVTAGCLTQPLWGAGLCAAWALFSLPAIATYVGHPSVQFLRPLPVARGALLLALVAGIAVIELPWMLLWWRGDSPIAALSAGCASATLSLTLRAARQRWGLIPIAVLSTAAALSPLRTWALPGLSLALTVVVSDAWLRPLATQATSWISGLSGPAWLMLTLSHLRILARAQRSRLGRSAAYFLVAGSLSYFAQQNSDANSNFTEVSYCLCAVLTAATLFPVALRVEHGAQWLLRSAFTPHVVARRAATCATLLCVLAATWLFSSSAQASVQAPLLPVRGHTLFSALSVVVLLCSVLRRVIRQRPKDANPVLMATLSAALLGSAAVVQSGATFGAVLSAAALTTLFLDGRAARGPKPQTDRSTMPQPLPILLARGLHKRLGSRVILSDVHLSAAPGQRFALTGSNGAGKTTLLQILSGQLPPDSGAVLINGQDLKLAAPAPRAQLGFVPDTSEALSELRVHEFLSLVRALKQTPVSALDVQREQDLRIEQYASRTLGELSLGQRKRVLLHAALFGDPALLLLDEPSNGLDPDACNWLLRLLKERAESGQVTLFSTNDAGFLAQSQSDVLRLTDGNLYTESQRHVAAS